MQLGSEAVLDQQRAMNGSHVGPHPGLGGLVDELGDVVDSTPRVLAGMLLGAILTLFLLRAAGFRFSFGVGVGGG